MGRSRIPIFMYQELNVIRSLFILITIYLVAAIVDWEGDYHCSKAEIKGMLRDAADETEDMKIVEQFDISAIDTESLKGFRNHHKS